MSSRKILLIAAGCGVAYLGVVVLPGMLLTRMPDGTPCPDVTASAVQAAGLDYTPRFAEEKRIEPMLVRTAQGQPGPDCVMSATAFRCSQFGQATVMVALYGKPRYFEVGQGQEAVLFGTQDEVFCVFLGILDRSG